MMTKKLSFWALTALCPLVAVAPPAAGQTVERVVAVVDEEPILLSEFQVFMGMAMQELQVDPADTTRIEQLWDELMEQRIEHLVLYLEAKDQGFTVGPEEIEMAVSDAIARNQEEIGSEELFRIQLQREGMTEEDLRSRYAEQAERELLVGRLVQSKIEREVMVTPEEVRAYFEENRESLPSREAGVHLQHILIRPRPDSLLVAKARDLAGEVAGRIAAGALTFAEAAARYSDDPNGREGGDLHRVERGDFAGRLGPDFEEQLFGLEVGAVSDPIASPLGFHLVTLLEKDPGGGWIHPAHILFGVPIIQADRARARERAEEVVARARAGESFERLASAYSDDPEVRTTGGDLGLVPQAALGEPLRAEIAALAPGEVSEPLEVEGEFHIFRVVARESERRFGFEEIEGELTEFVRNQKREEHYRAWLDEIKASHYIERRPWRPE